MSSQEFKKRLAVNPAAAAINSSGVPERLQLPGFDPHVYRLIRDAADFFDHRYAENLTVLNPLQPFGAVVAAVQFVYELLR
ncbi:MAG: hypothetical protein IID45_08630 [Planctomycetes bacterium]|nr:hypothetical protein [Planctomycetota bacterium]